MFFIVGILLSFYSGYRVGQMDCQQGDQNDLNISLDIAEAVAKINYHIWCGCTIIEVNFVF